MSIYQTCPNCGLSTSEGGAVCELCLNERTQKELDQLKIENERLREELTVLAKELKFQPEVDRLTKENARLRKTLEYIANPPLCFHCEYQIKLIDCIHGKTTHEIACEALRDK
jgi:dynactin complex subunit